MTMNGAPNFVDGFEDDRASTALVLMMTALLLGVDGNKLFFSREVVGAALNAERNLRCIRHEDGSISIWLVAPQSAAVN